MNKILDALEEIVLAGLMATATIIIFVAVVHRYLSGFAIPWLQDVLLSINLSWATELCIILFVWMAKIGAAYGVRTGIHVGVDIVLNNVSTRSRTVLVYIGLFCGVLFTATIGVFGTTFVWENGLGHDVFTLFGATGNYFEGPVTPDLEWSTWIVYSAVPLGSFLMCYRFLQVMVQFGRCGHLPRHAPANVDGLEEAAQAISLGEAIMIAEDIEHGEIRKYGGKKAPSRADTSPTDHSDKE